MLSAVLLIFFFFFQAEDGIRDKLVTGVQTCALPILSTSSGRSRASESETIVLRVDTARAWTESLGPQANACCSFFRSRCRWIVSAVRRQSAPVATPSPSAFTRRE